MINYFEETYPEELILDVMNGKPYAPEIFQENTYCNDLDTTDVSDSKRRYA